MPFGTSPLASTLFQTPTGGATGASNANGGSAIDSTGAKLLTLSIGASNTDTYNIGGSWVVTDNYSNPWQVAVVTSAIGQFASAIFYCKNPTVGTGHVLTLTCNGTTYATCVFDAWADGDATAPLDVTSSGLYTSSHPGTGNAGTYPGPVTPSQANSLVLTALAQAADNNPFIFYDPDQVTWNANKSFANINTLGNAYGAARAFLIQTTAATEDPDWQLAGSGYASVIAVFKPDTGGAGGTTQNVTISAATFRFLGANPTINAHQQFTLASALFRFLGQPTTNTNAQNVTVSRALMRLLGQPANLNQKQQFTLPSAVYRLLSQVATITQRYNFTIPSAIMRLLGQPTPVNNTQNVTMTAAFFRWLAQVPYLSNGIAGPITRLLQMLGIGN